MNIAFQSKALWLSLSLSLISAPLWADMHNCEKDQAAMEKNMAKNMAKNMERHHEKMMKHHEKMKEKLKITPAQESAWNEFTQSMQPPKKEDRPPCDSKEKLSAPERMEKHLAMQKKHQEEMEKRVAATKKFYAQLNPEQQKMFDEGMEKMMKNRHERGGDDMPRAKRAEKEKN